MGRLGAVLGAAALALVVATAHGQGPQASASEAWVAAPQSGASSTMAYAVVENPTMYEVYVVSVTTDAAGSADIADGGGDGAKVVRELSVPAYGQTELKPWGVHIRLKELSRPLKAGDTVEMTLTLDSGATIKVTAPVK